MNFLGLNNGTCYQQIANSSLSTTDSNLNFICICNQTSFTGIHCQTPLSVCSINSTLSSPCGNGSTCIPSVNGLTFNCLCAYSYSGINCDSIINPCINAPCYNNGTCYLNSAQTSYRCVCPIIYTGVRCEIPVNPCLLNGSCIYTSSIPNEYSTLSGKSNEYVLLTL